MNIARNVCKIYGHGKKKRISVSRTPNSDLLKMAIRHESDRKEGTMACNGALWVIDDCTRRAVSDCPQDIIYTTSLTTGHS